jgi:hypothetical protein
MQDIIYHVLVYTNIPDAVEFQEEKRNMDIDREVTVRAAMMEVG